MAVCRVSFASTVLLSLCVTSSAFAYCRTHTDDPPASSCPELCLEEGIPLAWPKPDLTYAFNERLFPDLTEGELRAIIAASFQTWEEVQCSGEKVGLDIRALSAKTPLELGPKSREPNENVIVHYDARDWAELDLPSRAFAITAVWFNSDNGDILGADMMFNGGMDVFGACSPTGCTSTDPDTDLRNVATHEAGHFLGLSHSDVPDSTMWCDADPKETVKRSLSPDDIAGLCDIYPPGQAFVMEGEDDDGGCGVSAVGAGRGAQSGLGAVFAVGSVLVLAWRRRRRPLSA